MNKELTIIINTFNSHNVIDDCINSIDPNFQIFVIENSSNIKFKDDLEKKYNNVKCFLVNDNLGYAKGNNFGLNLVQSKYALVLNPDTFIEKKSLDNFLLFTKTRENFLLAGPIEKNSNFLNVKEDLPIKVEFIKGYAMFFNMKEFNQIGFFDENFFIYCEEIDLCKRIINKNKNIFILPNVIINHIGGSSHNKNIAYEMELSRNWHWMWSQFYFNQKHYGYFFSLLKFLPRLLKNLIKYIFYKTLFKKTKAKIIFYRLSGLYNSIIKKKSWYRPRINL